MRHLDHLVSRCVHRVAAGIRALRRALQFYWASGSDWNKPLSGLDLEQRGLEERFQGQALQFAEDSAFLRAPRGADAFYRDLCVDRPVVVVRTGKRPVPAFRRLKPTSSDHARLAAGTHLRGDGLAWLRRRQSPIQSRNDEGDASIRRFVVRLARAAGAAWRGLISTSWR